MFIDHHREPLFNKAVVNKETNEVDIEYVDTATEYSCFMTVMFYDHKYINCEQPPTEDEINFWIALDSIIVDENQKDYISQIMNADETELTPEQINLKTQLNNPTFRNQIIELTKRSYENNKEQIPVELQNSNLPLNINRYQFVHIMHTTFEKLTPEEQNFKKEFWRKVASQTIDNITFTPKEPTITIPKPTVENQEKNPSEIHENSFETAEKILSPLSILYKPTSIASQTKVKPKYEKSEPIKNISVATLQELPTYESIKKSIDELENSDITEILHKHEKENVPFEFWTPTHQIHQITDEKIADFTKTPNEFINMIINGELNNKLEDNTNQQCIAQAIFLIMQNSEPNQRTKIFQKLLNQNNILSQNKQQKNEFIKNVVLTCSEIKHNGFLKHFIHNKFNMPDYSPELITKIANKVDKYSDEPDKQKALMNEIKNSKLPSEIKKKIFSESRENFPLTKGNLFTMQVARSPIKLNEQDYNSFLQKTFNRYTKKDGSIDFSKAKKLLIKICKDSKTTPEVKSFIRFCLQDRNFAQFTQSQNLDETIKQFSTQPTDLQNHSPLSIVKQQSEKTTEHPIQN